MSRVVLASCILCLCLMNVNLVATVHAEDLPVTKSSPDMQSKQTKSIIIDGVEYVPKSSIKGRKKTKTKSANTIKIGGVEYVPKPIDNSAQKKNDAEYKSEPKQIVSEPPIQQSSPSPVNISENRNLEAVKPKRAVSAPSDDINPDNSSKPAKRYKSTSIQSSPNSDSAINGDLENFAMKGKIGAGLAVSIVNLGIGPTAEYWITDNIVASGYLGLGSFTSYGIRGDYVFSKPLKLYSRYMAEPYAGLGYTSIKGPSVSAGTVSVKTEGSGVDFHAGLFMPAQYIYKNVAWRAEVAYSTATLDATATAPGQSPIKVSGSYSPFGLGFGIYYYFN